jgi:hypothetical protein
MQPDEQLLKTKSPMGALKLAQLRVLRLAPVADGISA